MTEQPEKVGHNPYAETYCPYCGAAEPHWNGPRSDPAWHDLLNYQDAEIARLRAQQEQLLAALKLTVAHTDMDWPNMQIARAAIAAVEALRVR